VEAIYDALVVGTRLAGDQGARAGALAWIAAALVPQITAATTDPSLVQEGLSERLANRGILPMFGFPTRVRLLYHKAPTSFPLRHVVDRDLELAVSMFAPGAETVKERTIYTAIGVAHYRRQGHMAVLDANPLGPQVRIGCAATARMWIQPIPMLRSAKYAGSSPEPVSATIVPWTSASQRALSATSPKLATTTACLISCRGLRGQRWAGRHSPCIRT
jgi:hypothetical protein